MNNIWRKTLQIKIWHILCAAGGACLGIQRFFSVVKGTNSYPNDNRAFLLERGIWGQQIDIKLKRAHGIVSAKIWRTQYPWQVLHCNSWQTLILCHWLFAASKPDSERRRHCLTATEMTKPDHNNHYQHTRRRLRNHEWGWSLHIPGLAHSIESEIPNIRVSECCQSCSIWPDHKQNAIRTTCHHQISRRTTATCATLKQHTQCVFAPKCRLTAYNHCESLNPASGWLLQTLSHCHSFQPFVGFHLCSKRSSGCNQSNHLIMTNHLDSMHSFVKESTSCQKMKSHLDCFFCTSWIRVGLCFCCMKGKIL